MKSYINPFLYILLFLIFNACTNYKRLITDEVVLKDGNSHTGTILQSDSVSLKLEKVDESKLVIPWGSIDTVIGKKYKTLWFGANSGYYKAPYFSVFRNESLTAENIGIQYKAGIAGRGMKLCYLTLLLLPDKPYTMNKLGVGFQRYLGKSTYLKDNSFFIGYEINLMNVKHNNGSQITFEPFTGFEKKLNERCRIHFKLGFQKNLLNKNNQTGVSVTIGFHFMKRNFKKYYEVLNKEHRIYRK